jgi:arsenate reductase (thioredoxin)
MCLRSSVNRVFWPLRDPKGLPIEEVRVIRDEVKTRVQNLIAVERVGK